MKRSREPRRSPGMARSHLSAHASVPKVPPITRGSVAHHRPSGTPNSRLATLPRLISRAIPEVGHTNLEDHNNLGRLARGEEMGCNKAPSKMWPDVILP